MADDTFGPRHYTFPDLQHLRKVVEADPLGQETSVVSLLLLVAKCTLP